MRLEVVTVAVSRQCSAQCERATRGYAEPNKACDSPYLCACLCHQSNAGRR